ncbi:hypothetical protein ATY78_03775 [Rhizobium sp. R635]|nr:hypothetical protein ATY78_03775 [Rhizobium sp. R635]
MLATLSGWGSEHAYAATVVSTSENVYQIQPFARGHLSENEYNSMRFLRIFVLPAPNNGKRFLVGIAGPDIGTDLGVAAGSDPFNRTKENRTT